MDIFLVLLPCSCVADYLAIKGYLVWDKRLVECPWCLATVYFDEFSEWFHNATPTILISKPPNDMFKIGGRMLEASGYCGKCHGKMVRDGSARIHLEPGLEKYMEKVGN